MFSDELTIRMIAKPLNIIRIFVVKGYIAYE